MTSQAGIRWFRAFPEWAQVQPRPGQWVWTVSDDILAKAKASHLRLSGGFWYFAPWATATGDTRTAPLKDIASWRDYVTGVVTHYQKDIREWEVYNEFNGSFSNSRNKPKDYAELAAAAYEAAKKVDPKIRIGMSCANFDLGFFDSAIKAGAGGKFDFIAVHPYENLSSLVHGGEDGYLSMAGSLRKMLAENHQRPDVGLWITEFGFQSSTTPDAEQDALQADLIVKGHVLALAQGFERVCWFEARGPNYGGRTDHGIIRHDWSLRPCYTSLQVMTGLLGDRPGYLGWINLAEGGYGFVFEGKAGPVLSAWSSKGAERKVSFETEVVVTDVSGKTSPTKPATAVQLGNSPQWIAPVPSAMLALARANASKPFPWGGDYAKLAEVSCTLGATNTDRGIAQRNPETTEVVHKLDSSFRTSHHKNSEGIYAYFRVDPQFASFGTRDLQITVVARRADPQKEVYVDVCYESLTGYKGTGRGKLVPPGDAWVEYPFTVNDANFVGGWGWNFRTEANGSGLLAIKEVRVAKAKPGGK